MRILDKLFGYWMLAVVLVAAFCFATKGCGQ